MPSRNVQCVYCHFLDGLSKSRPVRLPRPIQCVTTLTLTALGTEAARIAPAPRHNDVN